MFGVSVRFPEPGLVEVLGYAGVDYVLIDAEHGSIGWTEIERMIIAAYAADTTPIVRIHENNPAKESATLDPVEESSLVRCRRKCTTGA